MANHDRLHAMTVGMIILAGVLSLVIAGTVLFGVWELIGWLSDMREGHGT